MPSSMCFPSKLAVSTEACGRQLGRHIVDRDTHSRVAAISAADKRGETPKPKNISAIALLDFCAAFPSFAHEFIFLVLRALGFPSGLLLSSATFIWTLKR